MPTKRRRVTRGVMRKYSAVVIGYLETGDSPRGGASVEIFVMQEPEFREAWSTLREDVLAEWVQSQPGTRPWAWWEFDAPTSRIAPNCPADGAMVAQRARLGGIGTPAHEALNYSPWFRFGLPVSWVDPSFEDYYNGRSRDIHGNRIGTQYHDGHFAGLAPRANDPPRFESQAAFLKKHSLFLRGERSRLSVKAFEPDVLQGDERGEPRPMPVSFGDVNHDAETIQ